MTLETLTEPTGDPGYLAKDFNSFRSMMLDHLAANGPEWTERHLADLGVTLVETLAYVGDYLSYYQDAVAAEAYLATARQRRSVRGHARLVDYVLGEGVSARTWVQLTPTHDDVRVAAGVPLLLRTPGLPVNVSESAYADYGGEVFETAHAAHLRRGLGSLRLAAGVGPGSVTAQLLAPVEGLGAGDVLVLHHLDSDLRYPVRLIAAPDGVEIRWHERDALPEATPSGGDWMALGNIVLADHGRTREAPLPPVPISGNYAPILACAELTFAVPYDVKAAHAEPATQTLAVDAAAAVPALALVERPRFAATDLVRARWFARRDLLHAGDGERLFAVEPDGEAGVALRFGDGLRGARPQPEWDYRAVYRSGCGARGNIGVAALGHLVGHKGLVKEVTNVVAGAGGRNAETLGQARSRAPQAGAEPRRCVLPRDYEAVVNAFPGVAGVTATRVWSAGRGEVTLNIKRPNGAALDEPFLRALEAHLAPYRLVGDVIQITGSS